MNIGIDIRCLMSKELTGVGEYTYNLLKKLFEIDRQNQYFLFYNSYHDVNNIIPKFDCDNVKYSGFKWPNKLLNYSMTTFNYPKIDKLIAERTGTKIDLMFFPNFIHFSTQCPYIITAHDLTFELFPDFLSWQRRLWHKIINPRHKITNAKKVIAVSENTANDLKNLYNLSDEKITTILSGIDEVYKPIDKNNQQLINIKNKYNLPDNFILYLGTLEPRKNIESLITAFKTFHSQNPDYQLIIAGARGWKFEKLISQIECNENITHLNFIPSEEKVYFYNLAKMFVYPSYYEGFGFPPLESMAAGCPVITSHNSSLSEICGANALLIDPHNINDILFAMNEMVKPKISIFFREKGLINAKKFTWLSAAEKILNFTLLSCPPESST